MTNRRIAGDPVGGSARHRVAESQTLPVASNWFEESEVDHNITLVTEPHAHSYLRCNIWHLRGADRDLVIDAGLGVSSLRDNVPALFEREPALFLTHAHLDHIGGAHEFSSCYAHRAEEASSPVRGTLRKNELIERLGLDQAEPEVDALPDVLIDALPVAGFDIDSYRVLAPRRCIGIDDGDTIDLGDRTFAVLHVPGHSPGSIALFDPVQGILFSGDTVYEIEPDEELLDTMHGACVNDYLRSLERIAELPVTMVYPGHGSPFGRGKLIELIGDFVKVHGA